jgi:hypothetical protein
MAAPWTEDGEIACAAGRIHQDNPAAAARVLLAFLAGRPL